MSTTLRELRAAAALAPVRPAYAAGVRGALAVVIPLVAGTLLELPSGLWMSMAALNGLFADRGGAYRARAATLAAITCASAVMAAIATIAQGRLALVAPLAFLVAVGSGMTRAWRLSGASVGVPVLLTFLVALAIPTSGTGTGVAVERAAFILIGGAWAMLLTLALWPLRPYRPVRRVVADCYRELAAYVSEIVRRIAKEEPLGADQLAGHAAAVRRAVEHAREVLASTRRGRPSETGRGARLLELYEIADRCFVHVDAIADAIADAVETLALSELRAAGHDALTAPLTDVATTLRALAVATETERRGDPVPVTWNGEKLRESARAFDSGHGGVHVAHVGVLLDRMAHLAATAAPLAAGLETERDVARGEAEPNDESPESVPGALTVLRAALAPGSLVLRFSLRLGLVTAVAVVLTSLLDLPYGHWITITAAVVLQPYTGATTQRAIQRVLGTILGGAAAAGLSALFHDPTALVFMIAVFVAVSIALLPLNYAAFSVFITPAYVLLAEVAIGEWGLAGVRVLNTMLGGALALVAARVLWPEPEWNRFPTHVAAALRACRTYLHVVRTALSTAPPTSRGQSMRDARRGIGLAAINAEESFQRLLGEYRGPSARLEPAMAVLDYIRHFANSVASLALARHFPEVRRVEEVTMVATMTGGVLEDLAAALVEGRPPAALPERPAFVEPSTAPVLRVRLVRLVQQLEALHHAVTRWTAADAGTPPSSALPPAQRDPPQPPRVVTGTPTPGVALGLALLVGAAVLAAR